MFKIRSGSTSRIRGRQHVLSQIVIAGALSLLLTPPWTSTGQSQDGLKELRAIVVNASGRPAEAELERFESKYSGSRAAALAKFLGGYLHHSGQNYGPAVEALDVDSIGEASSIRDYALFYRAESESRLGKQNDARRDYAELYTRHTDSLLARDSRIRAGDISLALGDTESVVTAVKPLADSGDAEALFLIAQ